MPAFMKGFEAQTYAALRIVAGFLFLWHGMQKLFGFPGEAPGGAPAFVIRIAGPIEATLLPAAARQPGGRQGLRPSSRSRSAPA